MIEIIGGPDRDRTDDLFHAMEEVRRRFSDGITGKIGRAGMNRYAGRYLPTKCPQNP